jgi:hypothetical protein
MKHVPLYKGGKCKRGNIVVQTVLPNAALQNFESKQPPATIIKTQKRKIPNVDPLSGLLCVYFHM